MTLPQAGSPRRLRRKTLRFEAGFIAKTKALAARRATSRPVVKGAPSPTDCAVSANAARRSTASQTLM